MANDRVPMTPAGEQALRAELDKLKKNRKTSNY